MVEVVDDVEQPESTLVFKLVMHEDRGNPPINHRAEKESYAAKAPDKRWATDLYRVWTGRDGWVSLALVIDCCNRELLKWLPLHDR